MIQLPISGIRLDGGTQPRASINLRVVADYIKEMAAGAEFPPVDAFYDGTGYWLADGFHRIRAAEQSGRQEIGCEVHQGTQQAAQWFSFGVNKGNGLRRTNEDKQRAVKAALHHPGGAGLSDGQIAAHVGVSDQTVRNYRRRMDSTPKDLESSRRTGRDGRTINVARIGKSAEPDGNGNQPPTLPNEAPVPEASPTPDLVPRKASRRNSRAQKVERVTRLTIAFIDATKHLAHLVGWLGETAGAFDEAELLLSKITDTLSAASREIERRAVAADPLNTFRLGIQERQA
jgi:transposase-like protein